MFGSKNKSDRSSTSRQSGNATTLIAKHTEICGDVSFGGHLMIEGIVKGNIVAKDGEDAKVHVLDSGEVTGEISAPTVIVNGRVHGDVFSSQYVELAAKALVDGNVNYNIIEMVRGAQINGRMVFAQQSSALPLAAKKASKKSAGSSSASSHAPTKAKGEALNLSPKSATNV